MPENLIYKNYTDMVLSDQEKSEQGLDAEYLVSIGVTGPDSGSVRIWPPPKGWRADLVKRDALNKPGPFGPARDPYEYVEDDLATAMAALYEILSEWEVESTREDACGPGIMIKHSHGFSARRVAERALWNMGEDLNELDN